MNPANSATCSCRTRIGPIGLWIVALALLAAGCQAPNSAQLPSPAATPAPTLVPGRIVGRVQLEGDSNSGGVQVYVPGSQLLALTDERGKFTFDQVTSGTYKIMARADGYEVAEVATVKVEPSSTLREYATPPLTLRAKVAVKEVEAATAIATGSISGKVAVAAAGAGSPLGSPDWTRCVVQLDRTPYRTTCGPDGSYLLWGLPADEYQLRVALDGFESATATVRVLPGQPTAAPAIQLQPALARGPRKLSGLVELTAADGSPSNAFDKITVGIIGKPALTAKLNADGTFLLDKLPAADYKVTAWGDGFGQAAPVDVDLTSLPEMAIEFTLTAIGATSATATSAAAAAAKLHGVALKNVPNLGDMSGITVSLSGTSRMATTDADGNYVMDGIAPGTYQLVAQAQGFKNAQLGPLTIAAGANVEAQALLLEPDRAHPKVLAVNPPSGSRGLLVQREMPITVRFSKKMVQGSLLQAVKIVPPVAFRVESGSPQTGTDSDLMNIVMYGMGQDPVAKFDTHYKITIGTEAQDFEGLALEKPYEMTLDTGSASIIGTHPNNGGTLQDLMPGQPVVVYFNTALDHSTIALDGLRIKPTQMVTPGLAASEDPASGWTALSITMNWAPDTTYQITVDRRIRTIGHGPISNTPYTFSFRTAPYTPLRLPNGGSYGQR